MALHKIKDFDPNYREHVGNDDAIGLDLYSADDKIGSVDDALVDDDGRFRYLVIHTGVWILGKKVLLPIGAARIDYTTRRVYARGLSKEQVEALPEFTKDTVADYDHEEKVRGVYRSALLNAPAASGTGYLGFDSAPSTPNAAPPLDLDAGYAGYDRNTYSYDRDPDLYDLRDPDHSTLRGHQERLMTSKTRRKL